MARQRIVMVCRIKRTELVVSVTCGWEMEHNGHRTRPCDACFEVDQSGCLACPPVKRDSNLKDGLFSYRNRNGPCANRMRIATSQENCRRKRKNIRR